MPISYLLWAVWARLLGLVVSGRQNLIHEIVYIFITTARWQQYKNKTTHHETIFKRVQKDYSIIIWSFLINVICVLALNLKIFESFILEYFGNNSSELFKPRSREIISQSFIKVIFEFYQFKVIQYY